MFLINAVLVMCSHKYANVCDTTTVLMHIMVREAPLPPSTHYQCFRYQTRYWRAYPLLSVFSYRLSLFLFPPMGLADTERPQQSSCRGNHDLCISSICIKHGNNYINAQHIFFQCDWCDKYGNECCWHAGSWDTGSQKIRGPTTLSLGNNTKDTTYVENPATQVV